MQDNSMGQEIAPSIHSSNSLVSFFNARRPNRGGLVRLAEKLPNEEAANVHDLAVHEPDQFQVIAAQVQPEMFHGALHQCGLLMYPQLFDEIVPDDQRIFRIVPSVLEGDDPPTRDVRDHERRDAQSELVIGLVQLLGNNASVRLMGRADDNSVCDGS